MASRAATLKRITVDIVAEGGQPNFYELVGEIKRRTGASHAEANRAVMELLGHGILRTTMSSRIVVNRPDPARDRGAGRGLEILASLLAIVAAVLGIWEVLARTDRISGPGPIELLFPSPTISGGGGGGGGGGVPPIPSNGPRLGAPKATISGTCETGYTITWTAVNGAERYVIEADGKYQGDETGTTRKVKPEELFGDTEYTVIARAFLRPDSDPSNPVLAKDC